MRRVRVARREPLAPRGTAARSQVRLARQGRLSRVDGTRDRESLGLRERKKARLRQQIIDTSIRLFRKHGYENTRVEDIVQILEISQPTFFRYFPSKDAVLREVGRRGFSCIKEHLETELSSSVPCGEPWCFRRRWTRCGRPRCGDPKKLPLAF